MEADWEIEIGGVAPVIDAQWSGFVDLRGNPERIAAIAEAVSFPALGDLLLTINRPGSQLWTAKCDVWESDPAELGADQGSGGAALACYVDLLPGNVELFPDWKLAENFCRELVNELEAVDADGCRVDLVVRRATTGGADGFGITAYIGAWGGNASVAKEKLGEALSAFASRIPTVERTATSPSKIQ